MVSLSFLFVSTLLTAVYADNDWSQPCFSGVCQYDLPASAGSASGTLKIWGAENAIADITPAAGWQIIDCSPDVLEQDIRLVCSQGSAADCARLYTNGAEGKIVRLPENCGLNAFAVISQAWVPEDQSIPSNVAAALARRDGSLPEVQALHLSTDFTFPGTLPNTTGAVNFAIQAANVPGANGDLNVTANQRRGVKGVINRGLFDFVGSAIDKISSLNDFNINNTTALPPLDVDKNFNLVNQSISCPPVAASLDINVDAKAHAVATIGLAASGTIAPPKINAFAITMSLSADLNGTIDLAAGVSGTADSGQITLLNIPIGGLDFPGILTLGPSFQINAQATANLELDVGLTVGINYKIDNAQLVFPPGNNKTNGTFNVGDTPLQLSASPGVNATGTLEAHLIPSLNLGLSALGNIVEANVFLELDASATMNLTLDGLAEGSATISNTGGAAASQVARRDDKMMMMRRGSTAPGYYYWNPPVMGQSATESSSADASESSSSAISYGSSSSNYEVASSTSSALDAGATGASASTVDTEGSASFLGCVSIGTGLDVNAGATGDFFGLFNEDTTVTLFNKNFELFNKCFGGSVARRSFPPPVSSRSFARGYSRFAARAPQSHTPEIFDRAVLDLLCPASGTPAAETVADLTIAAADIKQL